MKHHRMAVASMFLLCFLSALYPQELSKATGSAYAVARRRGYVTVVSMASAPSVDWGECLPGDSVRKNSLLRRFSVKFRGRAFSVSLSVTPLACPAPGGMQAVIPYQIAVKTTERGRSGWGERVSENIYDITGRMDIPIGGSVSYTTDYESSYLVELSARMGGTLSGSALVAGRYESRIVVLVEAK